MQNFRMRLHKFPHHPWLETYNQQIRQSRIVIRGNAVMLDKNIIFADQGPYFSSPEETFCETPIKIS